MAFHMIRTKGKDGKNLQGGFTLAEILIALVILGLLLTGIYRVYLTQEAAFRAQEQITQTQQNLRATTEFLNQEMAWMGYQSTGTAVRYAAVDEIIFNANIPNLGTTVRFVRYQHNHSDETLLRVVGSTLAYVQNNDNLRVLANNVEQVTFTFFDGTHAALGITAGSHLETPADDTALNLIRQVQANITIKATRPDWNYNGHPDHYRRRSAIIDIKLRNVEDITIGSGSNNDLCSDFQMDITYAGPAGRYDACTDSLVTGEEVIPDLSDNPLITVTVTDPAGSPENVTPVVLLASDGYFFMDDAGTDISVISNRTDGVGSLYLVGDGASNLAEGSVIDVEAVFVPPEAGCIQLSHVESLTIVSGSAAYFDTAYPYNTGGIMAQHVNLDTGVPIDPQPTQLPVCSGQTRQGVKLAVRLIDECGNGIEGETVNFAASVGSFASTVEDRGDGTYEIVYIPPDNMSSVTETEYADITVTWDVSTIMASIPLIPASPSDIVVASIDELSGSGLYQFTSTVAPDDGSTFSIERVDGQWVTMDYMVTDGCGNRVFNRLPGIAIDVDAGLYDPPTEDPSTAIHTVNWQSDEGCGQAITNQLMQIADGSVTETITYHLLETQTGPRVVLSTSEPDIDAGDTSDYTIVTVQIEEYDPEPALCVNVPGPFDVFMEIENDVPADGNGSFSATNHEMVTDTITSDSMGVATINLHPGTANAGNTLTVTADADIDGASFTGNIAVILAASSPSSFTGYFTDNSYTLQMGLIFPDRAYSVDNTLYVQVQDYDENENPLSTDSLSSPYVSVVLVSDRTGDTEKINLTELGANTALFRGNIGADFDTSTPVPNNGTLQVLRGDTITMTYADKDDAEPRTEWTYDVYTSGPRYLELVLDDGVGNETPIFSGGVQVMDVVYGDLVRPKLFIPEYNADGSSDTDTMDILISSGTGGDTDTITLIEDGDTGIFIPDSSLYSGRDYITVTPSDPGSEADLLFIPYTPKFITVTYPAVGPVVEQHTIVMDDLDLPTVSLDAPTDLEVVSGEVNVSIYAEDTNNFTSTVGIERIDLYINGLRFHTLPGPDLTGTNIITWTTALGSVPYWLDGQHTMYAEATDVAGNIRATTPITVTVDNNLAAIEWTSPPFLSVWSQTIPVGLLVADLDTTVLTYNVTLSIAGTDRPLTDLGGGAWGFSWDSTEVSDGNVTMLAQVEDSENNTDMITLDVVVDHTPPSVNPGAVPAWISAADFPLMVDAVVADVNGVDQASVTGDFTGACNSAPAMAFSLVGGDTYRLIWAGPCSNVDGSVTLAVNADDLAQPPNSVAHLTTTSIDTIYPTLDPIAANPTQGSSFTLGPYTVNSFVAGTVTVSSRVVDNYPDLGWVGFQFYPDPYYGGTAWVTPVVFGPMDASGTGDFAYTWDTNGEYLPAQWWDAGIYVVAVDGTDMAANAATPVSEVYYLDKYDPWANMWISSWPVRGAKYIGIEADANYGFVQSITNVIVTNGGTPGIDDVASATFNVPITAKARYYRDSWLWDTTTLSDGTYDGYITATDWAGNQSASGIWWNFEVFNKYVDNMTAVFSTNGSQYRMDLTGDILHPLDSTAGVNFVYEVNHYDAIGSTLYNTISYNGTTGVGGAISESVPIADFTFNAGDMFIVRLYSDPENYWYGDLEGKVLSSQSWHDTIQVASMSHAYIASGPLPPGEYDIVTVDGTLLYANGDPAAGQSIRIDFQHVDRNMNWWFNNYIATTDVLGQFSIQVDAQVAPLGPEPFVDGDEMSFYFYDWDWNNITELNGFVPSLIRRD